MKAKFGILWMLFSCVMANLGLAQTQRLVPVTARIHDQIGGYYESLPADYTTNTSKKYPLLISLHGIGEVGDGSSQLPKLLNNSLPRLINSGGFPSSFTVGGESFSFIVISPQLATNYRNADAVTAIINHCISKYRVDTDRIYLTGLSMGGGLAWLYAGGSKAFADRLAAMLVVCGNTQAYPGSVKNIATSNLPVWITHNSSDGTVPVTHSTKWETDLNASGIKPAAILDVFNASGHDAWSRTYALDYRKNGMNVYEWMLSHKRGAASAPASNQAPTASAGANQTITLPTNSITLSGSGSDADGSIAGYSWTKVSGGAAAISTPSAAKTTVTGLVAGTYVFRLTVTDNKGATGSATVSITVNDEINQAPVANAGTNQTITLPVNSVTLSGNGTDTDGSIAGYSWAKLSGGAATIVSPSAAQTSVTGLVEGTYAFRLTVTDNKGATGSATVYVTVNTAANKAPTASAGNNQTITLPSNSITLNGSGADSDGTIASYSWAKISGGAATISAPSAASTTVTGLVAGSYVFRLTVTDNKGAAASANVTITVNPAAVEQKPDAPVVSNPAPVQNNGSSGSDCGCTATLSAASDGGIYIPDGSKYAPGSVLCIKAGTYKHINLQNFRGTAANPIIIKNCGGLVKVSGASYGISITKSSHFKFVGNGTPGVKYGIKVDGVTIGNTSSGLGVSNQSSDFEIGNLEITKVGAGVICKTNPTCDEMTWGGKYTMRNVLLHDMYIHDVEGEGFYVGHTSVTANVSCSGKTITVPTQTIENLKIYNCITENTGWDGIQVASIPVNCEVFNNVVKNYGTRNQPSQQMGILFGGLCNGKIYNNYIEKGPGSGLQILGVGQISAYNNVIVNCGTAGEQEGIYVDDRPVDGYAGLTVNLINNTIVKPGRSAIRIENSKKTITGTNQILNNLLVQPGVTHSEAYISLRSGSKATQSGNITLSKVEDAKFVNAGALDFHLASGSPAIDQGVVVSSWGVTTDGDGKARLAGSKVDAGAYEYASGQAVENKAPTANAGSAQTITLPASSVTLSGSGTDSDGTIAGYSWTKVSGPAATIASPSAAKTEITGLVEGTYVFRLTVTDNKGATGTATVTITVKPAANKAPVANAGSAQAITLPTSSVTLSGSGTDSDGSISKYAWTKVSGGAATIASPSAAKTNITGLVQGTYVFRLTVTDNSGATATSDVTVTVNSAANKAPVANAGSAQTITLPTSSITLSGSGTDSDGSISKYAWTKVSGGAATISTPSAAKTTVTGLVQGTYVFRLTVTDNSGATATSDVTVTVNSAANKAPVANAGSAQTITLPTSSVTLSGSGTDSDGSISKYAWTKVSGGGATIASPSAAKTNITGLVQGTYVFRLTVTDNNGATATSDVTVTVNPAANKAPVANAGGAQTITLPTSSVTLSGSGTDSDGSITSYAWTKVSGGAATISAPSAAKTTVTGLVQGTYVFRLTVTDNKGATGTATVTVTVNPAANKAPVANAGGAQTITLPTSSVTLSGSGTDSDGSIASYAWTKVSGGAATISTPSAAKTTVTGLVQGTYVFRLTVTDNKGATGTATVTVTVNAAPKPSAPVANAGDNQSITLPTSTVSLNAGKSAAANGATITSYTWTKVSGPAAGTISTPKNAQTSITGLTIVGTYVYKVTIVDNFNNQSTSEVTVTVKEGSPANVGKDELIIKINPNPVKTDMTLTLDCRSTGRTIVKVYDIKGLLVMQTEFVKDVAGKVSKLVDVSKIPNGIYIVQVTVDYQLVQATSMLKF